MNQSEREAKLRPLQSWDAAAIAELASLSRLRNWTFASGASFEPNILGELARLPMLQFLAFQGSELEHGNLRALAQLASLRRLDLKGCRFDTGDFEFLCEQWARRACPKLQELWLEGTTIGDEELRAIGQIERLRWLILSDTPVSDEELGHLRGLKKLETLWLRHTRVSEEGVLRLMELPHLSAVVLGNSQNSERIRDRLFRAQVAARKSKKPLDKVQVDAAEERLRAFLGEMEDWENAAYQRAKTIEGRHRAERPQPNVMADAEARENEEFWRDINVQKAALTTRYCSQKLLARGAGRAGSYGNPPQFQRIEEWIDSETPSRQNVIFYGEGRSAFKNKRRYTMILEEGKWKVDEVQWWSGGWKRDIV